MSTELLLSLFARIFGFCLISPLFAGRGIPQALRIGLAIALTLLLAPTFLATQKAPSLPSPLFLLNLVKEVAIGYLIGFIFSLLLEGAALAGEVVGTMMGLSATELLDPLANTSNPLMGRLFVALFVTLLLSFDLHHMFLRTLYESFQTLPITLYPFNQGVIVSVIGGTARLFQHALSYALIPLSFLFLLIILFAIVARLFPHFPLFWTAFPLQLLIGLWVMGLALGHYSEAFEHAFIELQNLIRRILFDVIRAV